MREAVIGISTWLAPSPSSRVGEVPHSVRRRVRDILPLGELCKDVLQYSYRLLQHIVVPIAHRSKSFSSECSFPDRVAWRFCVLAAVNFDDETLLETDEIKNVVPKRNLPAKLVSRKPAIPE